MRDMSAGTSIFGEKQTSRVTNEGYVCWRVYIWSGNLFLDTHCQFMYTSLYNQDKN